MGCCWLHSSLLHTSLTTEEESWQDDPVLLHDATRGYWLYHVNVGWEPAVGFRVWTEYFSIYVWVYLCVCVVCMHVCISSLMQNARGIPNHPVFHPVLFLPYSFLLFFLLPFLSSVSLSLLLSFGHLASVNRPLTEALRQLSHTGLCDIKGTHFIPLNLTAKASVKVLPINSYGQVINSFLFFFLWVKRRVQKKGLRSVTVSNLM